MSALAISHSATKKAIAMVQPGPEKRRLLNSVAEYFLFWSAKSIRLKLEEVRRFSLTNTKQFVYRLVHDEDQRNNQADGRGVGDTFRPLGARIGYGPRGV
jgi:hypothetical protein